MTPRETECREASGADVEDAAVLAAARGHVRDAVRRLTGG